MALKIIKAGEKIFQKTCPRCRCVFEHALSDLTTTPDSSMEPDMIECPEPSCRTLFSHAYAMAGKYRGPST